MGIQGLMSFVTEKFSNWDTKELSRGSKLVIDGNNVASQLYTHGWSHGGNYREFYNKVEGFFNDLKGRGIEPFVVFDGIDHEGRKFPTFCKRKKEDCRKMMNCQKKCVYSPGSLQPLFALTVFVDVVCDLGINLCFADGEADPIVAALANDLKCPVLAADSDFMIFELEAGFIPWSSSVVHGKLIEGPLKVYHFRKFSTEFGFDVSLRFLIPAILGNDVLQSFQHKGLSNVTDVIAFVAECESEQELIDSHSPLYRKFVEAREEYTVAPISFAELSATTSTIFTTIPSWIIKKYKVGRFQKNMINVLVTRRWFYPTVVDKFDATSAWIIGGKKMRYLVCRYICGILTGESGVVVALMDRSSDSESTDLIQKEITTKHLDPKFPLSDIPQMDTKTRQQILFAILHFDSPIQLRLQPVPVEWKLPVIATAYWFQNVRKPRIEQHIMEALILCFLTPYPYPRFDRSTTLDLDDLHAFAQWQCVYFNVIALNQLLYEPFQYVSPGRLFSGELAQHYTTLPDHPLRRTPLYKRLFRSVLLSSQSGEASIAAQQPRLPAVAGVNRFDILPEEDN